MFWKEWPASRRFALLAGVIVILAVSGLVAWWALRPTFEPLFSGLKETDAAEIATALDAMQVQHRYADGGTTLMVPAGAVDDIRLKLVAQGVPHGGSVGFESFKDSDFGVTEFAQRVNYQRALQGELERTIGAMPGVASVRVHLTLRRAGMFENDESPSKASVTLAFQPGHSVEPRQVTGIQRLVASAVDGLAPERVTVLGEGGVALSSAGGAAEQGDEQARVENRLRQRVEGMLHDVLGDATYAVSVDVRLNYDRIKQVSDHLVAQGKDGNGLVVRQKSSNTHGPATPEGDAGRSGGDAELEFAHGREQEEVERAPGRIERISMGVLVPVGTPDAVVARLRDVISAAAGMDMQRGDRLDIAAVAAPARAPVAGPVPVARPAASAVPAATLAELPGNLPAWAWATLGLVMLVGLAGGSYGVALRRARPARLTDAQRASMLADVRQWIAQGENA